MSQSRLKNRGVALILVLMMTAILGLLILQIGLNAKENVGKAQTLLDRVSLDLELRSREAALYYSLLTQPLGIEPNSADAYAKAWGFRGEEFSVDGATFRIQDLAGLLPFPAPQSSLDEISQYLTVIGVEGSRKEQILKSLREIQLIRLSGGDAVPLPLQSFGELSAIPELTETEAARLSRDVTLFPLGLFNPNTAPRTVLATKFQSESADILIGLRQQADLDLDAIQRITGQELGETLTFWSGPAFRIDARVERAGLVAHRETTLLVLPHESDPLIIWGQRRMQGRELDGDSVK